jgi:hypothetical protein
MGDRAQYGSDPRGEFRPDRADDAATAAALAGLPPEADGRSKTIATIEVTDSVATRRRRSRPRSRKRHRAGVVQCQRHLNPAGRFHRLTTVLARSPPAN